MGNLVRQPEVTVSLASADQAIANTAQKVLLIGQITAAGAAADKSLHTNIDNDGTEDTQFGATSQLAEMVRAFKRISTGLRVDAIALDDGAGSAATFLLTLSGTATENGTLTVTAGGEQHKIAVAVPDEATATEIGVLIDAAIDLDTDCPFVATNAVGVVTLTAENDGTIANTLPVGCPDDVAGITCVVTLDSAGATDPGVTTEEILVLIGRTRYQGVVWPYDQDTGEITDLLDARWNVTNDVLDGVAFTTAVDSKANLTTDLASLNTQSLVFFCDKIEDIDTYMGPSQPEASYVKSTYMAAIRALRLTDGAAISQYVTTRASLDQFGGTALCSLPYFNTVLPDLPAVPTGMGWDLDDIEDLLALGGSIMGVNSVGDTALLGEIVTTYLTDGAVNPDVTWTFLNYLDTSSAGREYMANNLRARFAQSRLTDGAPTAGRDVANQAMIEQYMDKLFKDLGEPGYMVAASGEDAVLYWKQKRTVSLALSTGTVTIAASLPIIVQARRFNVTIRISFSTTG